MLQSCDILFDFGTDHLCSSRNSKNGNGAEYMRRKQKFFFKGIDNEMAPILSVRRWLWKQYRAAPNSSQVVWVHWCAAVLWFCLVNLHPLLFDARWLYFAVIVQDFPELAQILNTPFVVTVFFLFAWILAHVLLLYFCHST